MQVAEWYKLFFNWSGIRYSGDVVFFDRAWFHGPVLKRAEQIEPDNWIDLDLTEQNKTSNLFLPQSFYIARLRWKEVSYIDDMIKLSEVQLSHNKIGSLKELPNKGQILIDCSKHEELSHRRVLVYPAWVLKDGKTPIT